MGLVAAHIRTNGRDLSGEILAAGESQELAPASLHRHGLSVQNQSGEALYVRVEVDASEDHYSLKIPAGALYEFPYAPESAVNIVGPTQGQQFNAKEW